MTAKPGVEAVSHQGNRTRKVLRTAARKAHEACALIWGRGPRQLG